MVTTPVIVYPRFGMALELPNSYAVGASMPIHDFLNISLIDSVSIGLCLITIWWCVRLVPKRSRSHHMLLGVLGIMSGLLATRAVDAVISMLFLGAAVITEMMDLERQEGVEQKIPLA